MLAVSILLSNFVLEEVRANCKCAHADMNNQANTRDERKRSSQSTLPSSSRVFSSTTLQETLVVKPEPGSLFNYFDICLYLISVFLAKNVCICVSRWLLMSSLTAVVMLIKYHGGSLSPLFRYPVIIDLSFCVSSLNICPETGPGSYLHPAAGCALILLFSLCCCGTAKLAYSCWWFLAALHLLCD